MVPAWYAVAAFALVWGFAFTPRANSAPDPASLLRQMYLASGGSGWDRIAGADLSGEYNLGGLKGTFHELVDFRDGRDLLTYDVGAAKGQQATARAESWWADEKGLVTVEEAPEALAAAASQSYEDRNGWFHPDPSVPMAYLGRKSKDHRHFDLVEVTPPAGRPLTLWIDSATHRLDRVVELDRARRESTTYFSDYRQTGGVWLPFVQRASSGDRNQDVVMVVKAMRMRAQISGREFAPPPSTVGDASIANGATSTTIPFTLEDGLIVVDLSLDGGTPLPFVLDSGALNVLTPQAAKKLKLKLRGDLPGDGVGNARITIHLAQLPSYRLGLAELSDQQFAVLPLPSVITDRGLRQPVAGLIGYEVLRRFVVRIDYHQRQITLWLPSARSPRQGELLPLFFDGRTPLIRASVDGVAGYFGLDTGDTGALTLFERFYTTHSFAIETPGIQSFQAGVGGDLSTVLTRVGSLSLGSLKLSHPLTELNFASQGAFSSTLDAGNLGSEIFRNFIITFDYAHRALYLQRSADFGEAMRYNRSGIHLGTDGAGEIAIHSVDQGSPAALAGVETGDRVLAIDHHSIENEAYPDLEDCLAQSAGTKLDLELTRDGQPRHYVVVLKELLPLDGVLQINPVSKPLSPPEAARAVPQ